jgi:outer membrane protein OmpA-like peptidoglycan-associated protein
MDMPRAENAAARYLAPSLFVLLASAAPLNLARAEIELERSLDTQLVFPVMSPDGLISIDSPKASQKMKFIGGLAYQLERMPLEYFENGETAGPAIVTRNNLHFGGAMSVTKTTTVFARMAGIFQDGGDEPWAAPAKNVGVTDLDIGFKAAVLQKARFALGPRFDLWIPLGLKDSWISERNARYIPSLLVDWDLRLVELYSSVGLQARTTTDSKADFLLGSELLGGFGLRVPIGERFSVLGESTARAGFPRFFQGGAENPVEGHVGFRYRIPYKMQFDLAYGTAVNNGYGTSDIRVIAGVTFLPPPPPPPKPPKVVEITPVQTAIIAEEAPEKAEVQWQEGQLAQVHMGQIVIREPIQFEFATPNILPESKSVLEAVAHVMNNYPQIEYLTVEGHASKEGSNIYNYDLSNRRSRAVFEALIDAGVRPGRIAYRGLGETRPLCETDDEACLARNRRVEFHILKVRDWLDLPKTPDENPLVIPWNGDVRPPPKLGDKMLSADANPILVQEVIVQPTQPEKTPDSATFKEKLDDGDDFSGQDDKKKKPSTKDEDTE